MNNPNYNSDCEIGAQMHTDCPNSGLYITNPLFVAIQSRSLRGAGDNHAFAPGADFHAVQNIHRLILALLRFAGGEQHAGVDVGRLGVAGQETEFGLRAASAIDVHAVALGVGEVDLGLAVDQRFAGDFRRGGVDVEGVFGSVDAVSVAHARIVGGAGFDAIGQTAALGDGDDEAGVFGGDGVFGRHLRGVVGAYFGVQIGVGGADGGDLAGGQTVSRPAGDGRSLEDVVPGEELCVFVGDEVFSSHMFFVFKWLTDSGRFHGMPGKFPRTLGGKSGSSGGTARDAGGRARGSGAKAGCSGGAAGTAGGAAGSSG